MMIRKERKNKVPRLPLTVWLSYLLVCTLLLTGVTFSSYVTSATGGDSARVAKFSVVMTGAEDIVSIDGSNASENLSSAYHFTVTNNSEVAVRYSVTVKTGAEDAPLPTGITLEIAGITCSTDGQQRSYAFNVGTLAPGADVSHTLTVTAALSELMENVDQNVIVSVDVVQID